MPTAHFIPLSAIRIPTDRIRAVNLVAVGTLRLSIYELGLLQPIVVQQDAENGYRLVFGEHRYRAFLHNYKEQPDRQMTCNGEAIPLGTIPVMFLDGDEDLLFQAELAENLYRTELAWPERVRALARLQREVIVAQPGTSIMQTAKKLADAQGHSTETVRRDIARAKTVLAQKKQEAAK